MIGQTVSHYRIVEKLGAGGMGVVYKAHDTKLDRVVALKFLPHQTGPTDEQKTRFLHEARSVSALDHANICTIYEIDETDDGQMFIAMGYYAGESLAELLKRGPLSVSKSIDIAIQVARGLSKAHDSGIVHRDIKPANLIITEDGEVKIVDFGLAKLTHQTKLTREGAVVGTASYMSPEQAQGHDVDHRTDLWSLAVVFFNMVTGTVPFTADTELGVLYCITKDPAPAPSSIRRDVPPGIDAFLAHCFEKSPDARPESAEAFISALDRLRSPKQELPVAPTEPGRNRNRNLALFGLVAVIAILGWIGLQYLPDDSHETRLKLILEARELIGEGKDTEAFSLLKAANYIEAEDPALIEILNQCSIEVAFDSEPDGATVYFKDYLDTDGEWSVLGTTPIQGARLPQSYLRMRLIKDGYKTVEMASRGLWGSFRAELIEQEKAVEGMTYIPSREVQLGAAAVQLPAYWMDTYEVTNRAFKEFVDAGGYQEPKYWKPPFLLDGRTLSWDEAMERFKDATGRYGPAGWELGEYPAGAADLPVQGVSWHEAAAYLDFAGKQLPTVYHWRHAAGYGVDGEILLLSNFQSDGPVPAGTFQGLSPFGNYDMAGNVQEWCWNEVQGLRYSLGGAWNDPPYGFMDTGSQAQQAFARLPVLGFRGMKVIDPFPDVAKAAIDEPVIDYAKEQPVGDALFAIYKESYAYDRTDLEARVESAVESQYWRKEKVSFRAAYGQDRVPAYLFLPRGVEPPYQTVIYFPGSAVRTIKDSEHHLGLPYLDFVIRSGRAVLYPVYQNTYERRLGIANPGPNQKREIITQWGKDIRRSIDYLETRPDIDSERIAYYALSLGSTYGGIFTAVEPRFKCSILLSGGLFPLSWPPDVLPLNFLPRSKVPTLMINGTYDFGLPVETSVKPMLAWMGVPEEDKKLFLFDGDHIPRANEVVRVTLDWLDRYLGAPR